MEELITFITVAPFIVLCGVLALEVAGYVLRTWLKENGHE